MTFCTKIYTHSCQRSTITIEIDGMKSKILHKQVIFFYAEKFTGTKKRFIMNFLESFCQLISNESKCDKVWKLLGILDECLRCFALFLNMEIRKASNLAQARKLGQLLFKFSHILCVNFECMNGLSNFVTLKLFRFTRLSFDI